MNRKPLITSGALIGIGMGGFVDGILFHQILQFHNMLSAKIPPDSLVNVEINMVWDGLFHTLTWIMVALGLIFLWKCGKRQDVPWSGCTFLGSIILGWGIFNLVEGIIDHHILGVHHVIERLGLSIFDYLFLASGIIFITVGQWMIYLAKNECALNNLGRSDSL